jgi:hypothetical protein
MYYGEGTWYNASAMSNTVANPATTDQFLNPHIITSYNRTGTINEHIHLSYYDSKDGSIKYKYNLRGTPGVIIQGASRTWINLDGKFDNDDDYNQTTSYTYTLTDARSAQGLGPLANTNDYLRATSVANNATVTAGQVIYTVGAQARNTTTNTYQVLAPIAGVITNIQQPTATGNYARLPTTGTTWAENGGTAFTITPAAQTTERIVNRNGRQSQDAGKHNAIAVTYDGFPVIAYYDETNSKLKLAVSNKVNPQAATDWIIRDNVAVPSSDTTNTLYRQGTGLFVSIAIDNGRAAPATGGTSKVTRDRIHIAAMSTSGNLVYITGQLNPNFTSGTGTSNITQPSAGVLTNVTVQVVDSLGTVGRWCKISLDQYGNPWIAYQDTGYSGAKDGVKLAYLNTDQFTKGAADNTFTGKKDQDMDIHGGSVSGWEAMHVPTRYSVVNPIFGMGEQGRIGLECFPTRNYPATNTGRVWGAAVSYLSTDLYRIAYYVK